MQNKSNLQVSHSSNHYDHSTIIYIITLRLLQQCSHRAGRFQHLQTPEYYRILFPGVLQTEVNHIIPVFRLPVRLGILCKILVLTYEASNGTAPSYIQSLLIPYIPIRSLCWANKFSPAVPKFNMLSYGARTNLPHTNSTCLDLILLKPPPSRFLNLPLKVTY